MVKITSIQPIIDAFSIQSKWNVTALSNALSKDRTLIHKYLKHLVQQGILTRHENGPHTYYTLTNPRSIQPNYIDAYKFSYQQIIVLDKYFLKYSSTGELWQGHKGFISWCLSKNLDPYNKIGPYLKIALHVEQSRNQRGLLDVTQSIRNRIESSALDEVYYADQYNWMEFGRGKLAEITFIAKDSQDKKLIQQCIAMITPQLECLIREGNIDAIAFTPHSRKRSVQLLKSLAQTINLADKQIISLIKYSPHGIVVAQKSLKTRQQRIENARHTILLDKPNDLTQYGRVLLIDDFVGSGATLNETAKKLKNAGAKHIIGFAFVGNANLSYDVINEI